MSRHEIENERQEYKSLLIQNPNYFGNLPQIKKKHVQKKVFDTKYEEIKCIGYKPDEDLLYAVINVKLPYGYKGGLCSDGSIEYVRFYVDWNSDGNYNDADEDAGIAALNVHDIPDQGDCLEKYKPLSYTATIKLKPKRKPCTTPYLVKVKAILSWETPPPSEEPNYPSVWGNVLESWIQIEPKELLLIDILNIKDLVKVKMDEKLVDLNAPITKKYAYTSQELKQVYQNKDVPEHRYDSAKMYQVMDSLMYDPSLKIKYQAIPDYKKIIEKVEAIQEKKYDTTYEEITCLGLDYDRDTLIATLKIKVLNGYSGGLCSDGSYEHVAFWAYIHDPIEQQCTWKYLGVSKINVHDLEKLPKEGLNYAVRLPVDLSKYKDVCSKPKIMKIRAVLSWNSPPSTKDPDQVPIWGNSLEALVQLKPLSEPGAQKPYIWSVGNMALESISGNPYTLTPSSLGDGYANGPSVGEGFTAVQSPFGSTIKVSGTITNAPNNPADVNKLRYKVQYRKDGETVWHDLTNTFRVWIRIDGVPSGYIDQVASGGYYKFQKDLLPAKIVEVQDDVLGIWHTPVPEGDGLYELRVLLEKTGVPAIGDIPANHVSSEKIKVMIDNTAPSAEVSLDAGACTKHKIGDTITGKFTANDKHFYYYSLIVEPNISGKPTLVPSSGVYPVFAGGVNQTYSLTTTSTTEPCGYVVRLDVEDRTIRNNYLVGNHKVATVGLCILEK
ncbi:hypothetical protein E4H04_11780 [Candidatus Bathyarchaeota archaeon]|nr:MAG: hypothetical protein E4H04_11780 [Candidatus Bathyarchaeota archaeon]